MLRIKPLFILCAALLTVTPAASADVNHGSLAAAN